MRDVFVCEALRSNVAVSVSTKVTYDVFAWHSRIAASRGTHCQQMQGNKGPAKLTRDLHRCVASLGPLVQCYPLPCPYLRCIDQGLGTVQLCKDTYPCGHLQ